MARIERDSHTFRPMTTPPHHPLPQRRGMSLEVGTDDDDAIASSARFDRHILRIQIKHANARVVDISIDGERRANGGGEVMW